jgi:hypothetical protein
VCVDQIEMHNAVREKIFSRDINSQYEGEKIIYSYLK